MQQSPKFQMVKQRCALELRAENLLQQPLIATSSVECFEDAVNCGSQRVAILVAQKFASAVCSRRVVAAPGLLDEFAKLDFID